MNFDANALLGLGYACFVIAWLLYVLYLLKDDDYIGRLATGGQVGGLLLWVTGYVWRTVEAGGWPDRTPCDVFLLLPVVCVIVSLGNEWIYGTKTLAPLVLVIVLAVGGYALFVLSPNINPIHLNDPISGNLWFLMHYVLAVVGYGMLVVSGASGVLELLRPVLGKKIPEYDSLSENDVAVMSKQTIRWAVVALTMSLALGTWWLWLTGGRYWQWTAAEVWMLITWAVYVAYLHLRRFRWWSVATVLGMALVSLSLGTLAAA